MKKVSSIIAVIAILTFGIQAFATGSISFDGAKKSLFENSSTLKKLRYNTYKAKDRYEDATENSKDILVYTTKEMYQNYGITFSNHDEMLLIKQRDLVPKQAKYLWEVSQNAEITTQNSMVINLRNLYLGLLKSEWDYDIKKQRLLLEEKKLAQIEKKYELGLISRLDLEEAEYNMLAAQKDLDSALRIKENAYRNINRFIGVDTGKTYDSATYNEVFDRSLLKPIEEYIDVALKERAEIVNAQKELEVKQLEKSILEINEVGQRYKQASKDYINVKGDIEGINLKIEKAKLSIENEIKQAYIDIKKDIGSIKNMMNTIDVQKKKLERTKVIFKTGMTTETVIEELKIGINEMENGYKLAIYNYNTKVMKLENSAGLGPAF